MTNPRIAKALELLPQAAHVAAARIEESFGKESAARYLKDQIAAVDSELIFKSKESDRKATLLSGVQIEGREITAVISGARVTAIETKNKTIWVPQAWLCRAMGWPSKKFTRMSPRGKSAKALAAAGYSFEQVLGKCQGLRKHGMACISEKDARVAIEIFQSGGENNVA